MSDNVVSMPPLEGRTTVQVLTELLAKATRGEVLDLAVAIIHQDGGIGFVATPTNSFYKMIGAIESMKFDMLRAHNEV